MYVVTAEWVTLKSVRNMPRTACTAHSKVLAIKLANIKSSFTEFKLIWFSRTHEGEDGKDV